MLKCAIQYIIFFQVLKHAMSIQSNVFSCEDEVNTLLVDKFFNFVISEYQAMHPACVCLQMCRNTEFHCYPAGCLSSHRNSKVNMKGVTEKIYYETTEEPHLDYDKMYENEILPPEQATTTDSPIVETIVPPYVARYSTGVTSVTPSIATVPRTPEKKKPQNTFPERTPAPFQQRTLAKPSTNFLPAAASGSSYLSDRDNVLQPSLTQTLLVIPSQPSFNTTVITTKASITFETGNRSLETKTASTYIVELAAEPVGENEIEQSHSKTPQDSGLTKTESSYNLSKNLQPTDDGNITLQEIISFNQKSNEINKTDNDNILNNNLGQSFQSTDSGPKTHKDKATYKDTLDGENLIYQETTTYKDNANNKLNLTLQPEAPSVLGASSQNVKKEIKLRTMSLENALVTDIPRGESTTLMSRGARVLSQYPFKMVAGACEFNMQRFGIAC